MSALTFDELSRINRERCLRWHEDSGAWTGADWATALGGECGEALNVVKKLRRLETGIRGGPGMADVPPEHDHDDLMAALADELADTMLYLDLLAWHYGIDLPFAIQEKFNRKSIEQGFPERVYARVVDP
jgi:NTP pyrophosphatase (non-canonical NTP hydrolase)